MEAGLTEQPEFGTIAWSAPWLEDWRSWAPDCAGNGWRDALNAMARAMDLRNAGGLPLRFVEQSALPESAAYEAFIHDNGDVPTRANLHDFFNALIWLSYPRIKRGLNAIQARELAAAGVGKTRGSVRDAATLFDENAALFACADPAIVAALRAHEWENLFIERRAAFGMQCAAFPFGHALLEKLTAPFKAITAHAWVVETDAAFFRLSREEQRRRLDRIVADQLEAGLPGAGFTPLPVLGIPGWATGQDAEYYRDRSVFRPKRSRTNLEH
ncbi:MAG TPA: DUF3025 domain-containing protein [Burkholderiaceae bacterium]